MKHVALLIVLAFALPAARAADHDKNCADLARTELNFCSEVATIGLDEAFLANMSDECFIPYRLSLTRSEYAAQMQKAREKAGSAFRPGPDPSFTLTWAPSKVEVSQDGTLGYTWGRYDLTTHGKDGKDSVDTGVYLTIWKKSAAGDWKIAFDGAPELPTNVEAVKRFLARADMPQAPKA